MTFPILYHKGKGGGLYSWLVWTEDDAVYTSHGLVGGEMQTSRKVAVGKNIGKANETTPRQQAINEATSLWEFKATRKYSETPEAANEALVLPMLALDIDKVKAPITYPAHIQPKLDGVRCLAVCDEDGAVSLLSRQGKEWVNLEHIQKVLQRAMPKGSMLDGELYVHGETFQTITSWCKKLREETTLLEFHVYDCPMLEFNTTHTWEQRQHNVATLVGAIGHRSVVRVETYVVNSLEEARTRQHMFEEAGYEGAILRLLGGAYQFGYRSRELLKMKEFIDAEYRIVGYKPGIGKNEDTVTWMCETQDGKQFGVAPKGTKQDRTQWLTEADAHVGKLLKVKSFGLTDDGIPRFPVGLGIRAEED